MSISGWCCWVGYRLVEYVGGGSRGRLVGVYFMTRWEINIGSMFISCDNAII